LTSISGIIALVVVSLIVYFVAIWWIRKWLIKHQVSCLWRGLFLAVVLAPGLMIYGEHSGFPLPSFAWMSGTSSAYYCMVESPLCSIKLTLFTSVLPFFATWIFASMMCAEPEKKHSQL